MGIFSGNKKNQSTGNKNVNVNSTQKMGDTTTGKKNTNGTMKKLQKKLKIDKLPKSVQESIPFRGVMQNGIIETYPGTFTRSYKLNDVNFKLAQSDEQAQIFRNFMDLQNSFNQNTKWQFCIYNHEIDKRETIKNIRIPPQKDGLNKYRQEMNKKVLLENLSKGNNSIMQEKFLTIAIEDDDAEHAATVIRRLDVEINKKLRRICKTDTKPMSLIERLKVLYSIYNQDMDYHFATGIDEYGNEVFELSQLAKQGASIKDVIGPPSFNFTKAAKFEMGSTYGQVLFLEKVPTYLSTDFIADLGDIQSNMLISVTSEGIDSEQAIKMVKAQLSNIEANSVKLQKRNMEDGLFGSLPPELEHSLETSHELMKDITSRNQNLFYVTVIVAVFADSERQLEENVKLVKSVAGKHIAPLKVLIHQQEFALNTALPLCRNDLFVERLYTTESASVFIPFNSQEINQKNSIFYGLNQTTKSMVMIDRLSGANYNGLIFGYSGSGKSFIAKCEMVSVILNKPRAQLFVIDPQGEYYPLCDSLHGERIMLAPGSNIFINPLDMDMSSSEEEEIDPTTLKADFVFSMLEIMLGKGRELDPICRTIIDRCVRKIYKPYIEYINSQPDEVTLDVTMTPTLNDLYQELRSQNDTMSDQLADVLEMYATGSFSTFAHRTNVKTNSRFVVYDIKNLGTGMRELGLHVCINDIWNRMIANSKRNIYTWFYIDEFHLLLESESSTAFLKRIWKMARKWLGVPTGILQNTEDLLRNADSRAIVNNTTFVIMLKEPLMDRQNLAELFNLSDSQLEYITESEPGHGLIYNGKVILPFEYDFPKDTELYKIMSTSHDVHGAKFA